MPKVKQTPEEKKAAKAGRKLLRAKKAQELKIQHQHDYLYREIKYGASCFRRHEKQWRAMLVEIAMPRMRADLEYAWHNFERVIDSKDFIVSLLLDELQQSDEQYSRMLNSHMDNIDTLIVVCYDQIGELWQESKEMIHNLYTAATFERTEVTTIHKEHEDYLKTMLYTLDKTRKETIKLMRGDYLSRQEVEMSRFNEIGQKFTEKLQRKFDIMWSEAEEFLRCQTTAFNNKNKQFMEATAVDKEIQREIRLAWAKIGKKNEQIKMGKAHHIEMQQSQQHKIDELNREMKHFESISRVIKRRVEKERNLDQENITCLTLQSNHIVKELRVFAKRGEQLLALSAICRKYEMQTEKVMRFPLIGVDALLNTKERREVEDESELLPELRQFWCRVAAAEVSRYRVKEQCDALRLENDRLRQQIHAYCACLNCSPHLQVLYGNHRNIIGH